MKTVTVLSRCSTGWLLLHSALLTQREWVFKRMKRRPLERSFMRYENEEKERRFACLIIIFCCTYRIAKKKKKIQIVRLIWGYFFTNCFFTLFIQTITASQLCLHIERYSCTGINFVGLCSTAGQRWSPSSPAGHPASLHQLARLWGAILTHRYAEIPQEGQGCQSFLCWTNCCALQVRCLV